MHTFKILALSLLSAATAAPTAAKIYTNDPDYFWSVTNWSAGCAHSGCNYNFNISGPAYNIIPAFSAYCSGYYEGAPYTPCEITDTLGGVKGVAAKLLPVNETGTGAHLAVSYEFFVDGTETYYNYTGFATSSYNAFVAPLLNFTVTPTEAWGVA